MPMPYIACLLEHTVGLGQATIFHAKSIMVKEQQKRSNSGFIFVLSECKAGL